MICPACGAHDVAPVRIEGGVPAASRERMTVALLAFLNAKAD